MKVIELAGGVFYSCRVLLFHTQLFLIGFLPVVLLVFFWLDARGWMRVRLAWLIGASLFFYGWWNPAHVPLLLVSIVVNYVLARALVRVAAGTSRRAILLAALAFNLGLLGYYKYAGFFLGNLNLAVSGSFSLAEVALPLAISFYTFQQISFQVDTWRRGRMTYSPLEYGAYVAFFPQLIAGPIVRHSELIPQFADRALRPGLWRRLGQGLTLVLIGIIKKAGIADYLATRVDPVYADAAAGLPIGTVDAWLATTAFWWQVYFDFSGYSDMALGLALMFGFRLPLNFNIPFMAASIAEFWQRWHITLSRFLRDYLFRPMARAVRNRGGRYAALFITMVLGGLWHGAGWTFIIWGALNGLALVAHRLWSRAGGRMPGWLGIAVTLVFLIDSAVLFRSESLAATAHLWAAMHAWVPAQGGSSLGLWLAVIAAGLIAMVGPSSQTLALERLRPTPRLAVFLGIVFTALLLWVGRDTGQEFVYFQF